MNSPEQPRYTNRQCAQWLELAHNTLRGLVAQASSYLPVEDGAMDDATANDILDALETAAVSMAAGYGIYDLASKREQQVLPPPVYKPQQVPQYTQGGQSWPQ